MQGGPLARNGLKSPPGELLAGEHPWGVASGRHLKRLRESLEKGQDELGVSRGMVSLLERGKVRPGRDTLATIAKARRGAGGAVTRHD